MALLLDAEGDVPCTDHLIYCSSTCKCLRSWTFTSFVCEMDKGSWRKA